MKCAGLAISLVLVFGSALVPIHRRSNAISAPGDSVARAVTDPERSPQGTSPGPAAAGAPGVIGSAPDNASSVLALAIPARKALIRAEVTGTLKELTLVEGAALTAADEVGRIDSAQLVQETEALKSMILRTGHLISEAESHRELASYDQTVNDKLSAQRVVTASSVAEVSSRAKATTARLMALRSQKVMEEHQLQALLHRIRHHGLRSPISGTISRVLRSRGEFVREGDLIAEVVSHELLLKLHAPEDVNAESESVHYFWRHHGREEALRVARLSTDYNPDGTRTVFLSPPAAARLKPGRWATVRLQIDPSSVDVND